jgi:hypothetical protein
MQPDFDLSEYLMYKEGAMKLQNYASFELDQSDPPPEAV